MARDRANIRVDMLSDTDYRQLGLAAQHLYKMLLIHPTLSYAGVADWRPGRLAKMTRGITADDIRTAAKELQEGAYIYTDDETEEVLIRSFVRHDGLLKRNKVAVAMATDYGEIASPEIRQYFAHELKRLHDEEPELKCWEDKRVHRILSEPQADLKAITHGDTDPSGMASGNPSGMASGMPSGMACPMPSDKAPPTTATATATATPPDGGGSGGRRAPETPLPADWAPNDAHKTYANEHGIDLDFQSERFKSWSLSKDARYRNWDQAFRNWLLKAEPSQPKQQSPWDRKGIH